MASSSAAEDVLCARIDRHDAVTELGRRAVVTDDVAQRVRQFRTSTARSASRREP